ncbi:hypothetical protein HU200_063071 [Digitaria exilis]|uniref:Uncharacterized protein n=1 Tax=Digitaria exilis TaxID=1010633 RepID=A0A835DVH9_9POAL|nr:hypothetical protein HU200_063071 [Digitaria exilis]
MKTKKTVNGSSCKKGKLFDGLIGKHASEMDPSYKLFLEHLSKDGNTCVLNVPNGDHGMPVSVRYEEDDTVYSNKKAKNGPNCPSGSLHRSWGVPSGKRPDLEAVKAASGNVDQSFSPKRSYVKQKKNSTVDDSYELFMSLVKFKDGCMVIEPEPGVTIVYEQEEDMPDAYDELRTGSCTNEPEALMSPLETMEEDCTMYGCEYAQANKVASERETVGPSSENIDGQDIVCTDERGLVLYTQPSDSNACEDEQAGPLAISCIGSSTFDEKLNAILSQPYDQNEYEELWRKASDQKPVSRQRHLRSASKRYVTGAIGLSYLDHYPDLAVQINSADCDERLSLLRKFFFWLENLCHEGAYMPWISKPLACNPPLLSHMKMSPRGEAVS